MTVDDIGAGSFRALIEMATEPLYVVGSDGRFELVNEEFEQVTGYNREQLVGMKPERLLHDEDDDEWTRRVQLLKGDRSTETERWVGRIESKHGTEVPLEWVISLQAGNGQTCVVGRAKDLREEDRQKQKLDVLNRTLRHNIRNQMNIIVGKATTLQNVDDEGYRTAAEKIETIGKEIISISNKARKAQEHVDIPPDEECQHDLAPVVESTVAKFGIKYPSVNVVTTLPDEAHARAPPSVETALLELFENAAVHHPSGSGPVFVTVSKDETQVSVQVEDECEPIPEQVQEVVSRGVEQPLKHSSGLGLWIVQWAVESVGGSLTFDRREDDAGNVVTLTFERISDG